MATFKFGRAIDLHWQGYEIVGPAETVFSIPDQLYEEFNDDIAPVEPTLVWIDTNEFLTLSNSVSVTSLTGTIPISVTSTTSGKVVSISSTTNPAGYYLRADGTGATTWAALPADATGITNIIGTSPISAAVVGTTATISLNANYQTAGSYQPSGTYVTGVSGTAPITASGTTSITVGIDQTSLSAASALNAEVLRHSVKNTTGTTIPKGSAVYVSGATGDNALISLASASSEVTSSKTLGITAESIANDAFGYVIESGYLTGIDTSATTAGAAVWLGNTPGSLVFVSPPTEPSNSVYLGVVARVQSNNGSILVKVQNGYELNELHDVFVTGVSTSLPLVYSSASSGWIAQALSSVGIADNAIVAAKIAAGSVGTSAISSGAATSGQLLQANGAGAAIFATVAAGATVSISEFTASGTWTKPSGATAVYVLAVGAGAGGGSGKILATGTGEMGGKGGWGGSTAWRWIQASSLSSSVSVTIGAGGSGGAAVSASAVTEGLGGSAGGNTSFGTHVTASGGCITPITSVTELPVPSMRVAEFGSRTKYSSTDTTHTLTENLKINYSNPYFTSDINPSAAAGAALFTAGAPGMSGPTNYSGRAGMDSATQTGGGGGGGSTNGSADAVNTGGAGGRGFAQTGTAASGGSAGSTGGAAGGTGSTATLLGSGGGGGGATVNGTAGSGGNGYLGGGGGGGGGVFRTSGTRTSGAGGTGGGGYLIVISI